jgi:EsV-1-7 cysteine-rich motif
MTDGSVRYCATHKKDDMVNIVDVKCAHEGCQKIPSFGFVEGGPRYCLAHKQDAMVNVVDRKCAQEGCRTIPTFGHAHDGERLFCKAHKEPSMVNVVDRKCEVKDCKRHAYYGLLSDKVCCVHYVPSAVTPLCHMVNKVYMFAIRLFDTTGFPLLRTTLR